MKSLASAMVLAVAALCGGMSRLGGVGSARAMEADTLRLSLPDCERRVLDQGEEMKQAQEDYASTHAAHVHARAQALPQLNLSTGYTRQIDSVFRRSTGGDSRPSSRIRWHPWKIASALLRMTCRPQGWRDWRDGQRHAGRFRRGGRE